MYSKQVFRYSDPFGFISVFKLTALKLLKLEIIVCFLWLSLPVHSWSPKSMCFSELYSLSHHLSFEYFHCSFYHDDKGTHFDRRKDQCVHNWFSDINSNRKLILYKDFRSGVSLYDGPDLKLFFLVGWVRSSLSVAWSTEAQLMIFFYFSFSVVLFDRPVISICHATHCIC